MLENKEISIAEAMEIWKKKMPACPVSRQTIRNWAIIFGWIVNDDRPVKKTKILLDRQKFEEFSDNPRIFLNPEGNKQ